MSATSFVDVRHVFVDYTPPATLLARLSGRKTPSRSALRDVTFQLAAGQHVALFGAPGAGKSTLLRTLSGVLAAARGHVIVNGRPARETSSLASGYVSVEESEPVKDTIHDILHAFAQTHNMSEAPARIGAVADVLGITSLLERQAATLSTTERLRVNIARAALGASPLILLDDVTDQLGAAEVARLLPALFAGRVVVAATRLADSAQGLNLPILILHKGALPHFGMCDDLASATGCPRVVRAWLEGLRYDTLRVLKRQPGVMEVRLMSTDQFEGQQLRIVVRSSRYLPALYDVVSQAGLLQIEEEPVLLQEIVANLDQ